MPLVLLAIFGCDGHRGMDQVIALKDWEKIEGMANDMTPQEAEIFQQTVVAEIQSVGVEYGMSAWVQGLQTIGDPSRDPDTSEMDKAVARLQALEGKTARAATVQ